ncbi:MAG: hypothetical protein JSS03_03685 [Proteobacteria bacterium]|nr:hypothetical protein [Pseudomonadota bacterium]
MRNCYHICTLIAACIALLPVAYADKRMSIPVDYEAGHYYAVPETTGGQRLRLLVDTGGAGGSGLYVINAPTAKRLGLKVDDCALGDEHAGVVAAIGWREGKALPVSAHSACNAVALVSKDYGLTEGIDGVLGAGYLPGHVWTFDYPDKRLWLEPVAWRPAATAHRTELGFELNEHGGLATGFPRIQIHVDGQAVDLLLDTGATAKPTAVGERASGIPTVRGIGVTSYITTGVFNRWHSAHPNWRVVGAGDDLLGSRFESRLIEVPQIEVAGWKLGPVWFTERPDGAFRGQMSQWMDRPIDGSLGANVLAHFVMTLDYPRRALWLDCAHGCGASGK